MTYRHTSGGSGSHLALASHLARYQRENGLDQRDIANLLGVTQSYVSRFVSQKRDGSADFIARVIDLIGIDALAPVSEVVEDASELYERGLVLFGGGDVSSAEVYFELAVRDLGESTVEKDLEAKAKSWIAGVRRDRNAISGPAGAWQLYAEVAEIYRAHGKQARLREVRFMQGACLEMQKQSDDALRVYQSVLADEAIGRNNVRKARLNYRIGALLTKSGEYSTASKYLGNALKIAVALNDNGPYSYGSEKVAILHIRQRNLDLAYKHLMNARAELRGEGGLRNIQSMCVEADMLENAGEQDASTRVLRNAFRHAVDGGYAHQEMYIQARLNNLAGGVD